jgi:FK506-binding protein 2
MTVISILLLLLLAAALHQAETLDWRRRRDSLLGIERKKKVGYRKVKSRAHGKNQKWEWEPDAALRVGVKHRPKNCSTRSKTGDYLSVHYNGTLYSNGDLFDSSILREEPFVFQIGRKQMLEGFEKGLLNMCIGEKRKLVVPSNLGYGMTKALGSEFTGRVQPGSTLVYHVELLEVLSEEEAAPHLVWGV